MVTMSDTKKKVRLPKFLENLTLEKVFSTICFLAGIAFLIAALHGAWRHFITMGLCFAIGVMIADSDESKPKKKRHD